MKILLTAFDPFGAESVNPASLAVAQVTAPQGIELIKLEVPTVFGESIRIAAESIEVHRPHVVLCIGQAGGRSAVTPERVAINLMDAAMADNRGLIPVDQPVIPGGENALFSTVPVKAMVSAIRAAGVPAQLSNTAGTFVCNQLLYGVLHLCKEKYPDTRAGFIHVPFLPQQVENRPGVPSLPLSQMVAALQAVLSLFAEEIR